MCVNCRDGDINAKGFKCDGVIIYVPGMCYFMCKRCKKFYVLYQEEETGNEDSDRRDDNRVKLMVFTATLGENGTLT